MPQYARCRDGRSPVAGFSIDDRRRKMKRIKQVALFDHQGCQTKFFARFDGFASPLKYRGRCPNPHCNRTVSLFPETLFNSMDKARRAYIKLTNNDIGNIFWQT